MSAPGLVLSDRYRLGRRIAIGGMGEVWTADDTRLARVVAVKILRPELTGDPEFVERFRTEARITASLNHPGIAAVYDYGEVGPGLYLSGTAYLVMELIAGESLSAVLARTGRLSVPRTLDVLDQTGRALQQAHTQSLVHRDIKPGNLLITPGGQVKITDFGIAKVAHQAPVTRTGLVMGTAQYISPEQAAGRDAVPASDIYSLGVVAYECLSGRLPFPGENAVAMALAHVRDTPQPLPPDIPPVVAGLVMQMLIKDPAARFPNGATLAQAVGQVRAGAPGGVRRTAAPPARTRAVPIAAQAAGQQLPPGSMLPSGRFPVPTPAPVARSPQAAREIPVSRATVRGGRPAATPGTATAYRPQLVGPNGRPIRPANRHTGLSVLLALLVLVLAGIVAIVINTITISERALGAGSSGDLSNPTISDILVVNAAARPGPMQNTGYWLQEPVSGGRS
jgi:serine/threonine-protein kinase